MISHPAQAAVSNTLEESIAQLTIGYLKQSEYEQTPIDIYRRILDEVERALFSTTMDYTFGNQSRAASQLGINRATLRTKLKRYGLM